MKKSDKVIREWHRRIDRGLYRSGQISRHELAVRLAKIEGRKTPTKESEFDRTFAQHEAWQALHLRQEKVYRRQRELGASLGPKIRRARVEMGMTQQELGEAVGIAGRTICSIELGERSTSVANLREMCLELGIEWKNVGDESRCKVEIEGENV